ncbi:MAG: hypothetical protein IPM79_39555 [Polyangiaceae bacterium]|nr:hypothetical protein [Polyangiaceae bacterium]
MKRRGVLDTLDDHLARRWREVDGGVDLYLRTNGGGSMLSVFRLEASTNNESLWAEGNLLEVGLSSRFASFWGQTFFTVTSPNTHEILAVTAGYGTATLTGLFTADENPSSDLDPRPASSTSAPATSARRLRGCSIRC